MSYLCRLFNEKARIGDGFDCLQPRNKMLKLVPQVPNSHLWLVFYLNNK